MTHHEAVAKTLFPDDLNDREKKIINATARLLLVCYEEAKRDPNPLSRMEDADIDHETMTLRKNVEDSLAMVV